MVGPLLFQDHTEWAKQYSNNNCFRNSARNPTQTAYWSIE